jgi:hypothetical protein
MIRLVDQQADRLTVCRMQSRNSWKDQMLGFTSKSTLISRLARDLVVGDLA